MMFYARSQETGLCTTRWHQARIYVEVLILANDSDGYAFSDKYAAKS